MAPAQDRRIPRMICAAAPPRSCIATDAASARALLGVEACIDQAVKAIETYAPEDLAAAHLVRAQVKNDSRDLYEAWKIADAAPQTPQNTFNLALTLEALGLTDHAIATWDQLARTDTSAWGKEAAQHRERLKRNQQQALQGADEAPPSKAEERLWSDVSTKAYSDLSAAATVLKPFIADWEQHGRLRLEGLARIALADVLMERDRFTEALGQYEILLAGRYPTEAIVDALARRALAYRLMGDPASAWSDASRAVPLIWRTRNLGTRHTALGSAAEAAQRMGSERLALLYMNTAVRLIEREPPDTPRRALHLGIALRKRAEIEINLNRLDLAKNDLDLSRESLALEHNPILRALAYSKYLTARAEFAVRMDPAHAPAKFTEAIAAAKNDQRSQRAILFMKRSAARRRIGESHLADADAREAMALLTSEQTNVLDSRKRGELEELWSPYFTRFRDFYDNEIARAVDGGRIDEALSLAEQSRAFEPLHLLLHSQPPPAGFRRIESLADIQSERAKLPAGTFIFEYVVLRDKTIVFIVSRDHVSAIKLRARRQDIERWVTNLNEELPRGVVNHYSRQLQPPYAELIDAPFRSIHREGMRPRIVIVADGPMHGLPFPALSARTNHYFIEDATVSTAASTSLYLYALARDREFARNDEPSVLLVSDPAVDPVILLSNRLGPLPYAAQEHAQIAPLYGANVKQLVKHDATVRAFLKDAQISTVIHFAGHSVADSERARRSRLFFASEGNDIGELTAEDLITRLTTLARTRLIVLAGCSTAAGNRVGAEGLAPLVRPLIAASVPAVVGTLWNVNDATANRLVVSFHRHYRNGDDVATALCDAQLEILRDTNNPKEWAAFQVIGYAASPYAHAAPVENQSNDHLCTQNSLHGPDGLHPQ
jgi:CHAT domain-containing protein